MITMMRAAVLATGLLAAMPAVAEELVIGLGVDEIRNRGEGAAPSGLIEYRSRPFAELAGADIGYGFAAEADTDGDLWGGGGLVAAIPLGSGFRLIGSAMIGVYDEGSGNDLGSNFPMFRSQLEIDRAIGRGWRAGLALSHKSNAGTGDHNPGVETLYLTLSRTF